MPTSSKLRPLAVGLVLALGAGGGIGAGPDKATKEKAQEKAKAKQAAAPKDKEGGLRVVPPIDLERLPQGRVLVEICEEGVPQADVWAARPLEAKERYETDAFGFSRFPPPHRHRDPCRPG